MDQVACTQGGYEDAPRLQQSSRATKRPHETPPPYQQVNVSREGGWDRIFDISEGDEQSIHDLSGPYTNEQESKLMLQSEVHLRHLGPPGVSFLLLRQSRHD